MTVESVVSSTTVQIEIRPAKEGGTKKDKKKKNKKLEQKISLRYMAKPNTRFTVLTIVSLQRSCRKPTAKKRTQQHYLIPKKTEERYNRHLVAK